MAGRLYLVGTPHQQSRLSIRVVDIFLLFCLCLERNLCD